MWERGVGERRLIVQGVDDGQRGEACSAYDPHMVCQSEGSQRAIRGATRGAVTHRP